MQYPRKYHFDSGVAMVVTDLHGIGVAFDQVIQTFFMLKSQGKADRLVFCGDVIHGYGKPSDDHSLRMIVEIIRLQAQYGSDTIVMLMGNHEMPHVYGVSLSKGNLEFTARFEQELSRAGVRDHVHRFLMSLPVYISTHAGVLLSHAGPTPAVLDARDAENILTFDHAALLHLAEDKMRNYDMELLRRDRNYGEQVKHFLAVSGVDDPRYHHLLRGQLISQREDEFRFLWDVLFATNEQQMSIHKYQIVVDAFLEALSAWSPVPQRFVVAGHIAVRGGHAFVGNSHFRLATFAHATPNGLGEYLLLDCGKPINRIADLANSVVRLFV